MSTDTDSRNKNAQVADDLQSSKATELVEQPIVFFDGVCALCNHSVQQLLTMDRKRRLKFAPLQGETAQKYLPEADIRDLKTLIIRDHRGIARHSTAVVRILWQVGGIWSFLGTCLWLIPSPIRNGCYRFVSARRYKWFGKHDSCRMPQPGEQEQFLP